MQRPDGGFSTELSAGVDLGNGEVQIPLIVPTLTQQEVATLLSLSKDEKAPRPILDKAVAYARKRKKSGLSPFKQ